MKGTKIITIKKKKNVTSRILDSQKETLYKIQWKMLSEAAAHQKPILHPLTVDDHFKDSMKSKL